ncbi:hypothetical protein M3D15_08650 [Pseudoclavibacter alba]|uniref:CHAP domain-containing protein n=1 Tax=Pseudoclavibacter albus TaxID=272241 RepID=A0ABT2HYJ9_9MICO|nr:hypothetical protein [Pseudoclavibacter alba]MCT2043392.1 hypothetical protein [Pseudoclavibacter alba]
MIAEQMRQWLATGERAGRDWTDWCQALVWWACELYGHRTATYETATDALHASEIVSADPDAAPEGAIHYWQPWGEPRGHVAIALGDGRCLMASPWVDEYLGWNVGIVGVRDYSQRTGSAYVGWSYTNGENYLIPPEQRGTAAHEGDDDMTPDQAAQLAHLYGVSKPHGAAIHEIRGLVQNIARVLPGVAVDAHGAHESADIAAYLGHQLRDMSAEQLKALREQIDSRLADVA